MKGIDFSWARPGGAAIKAAGNEFVMRYVPFSADNGGHGITAAEVADYRANGLAIGLVFESGNNRHLDGFGAGAADACTCIASRQWTGFPDVLPFYFGCDFDAQPSQFAAIDDYQRGAASVLGKARVGIYGSYAVVKHCAEAGTAAWLWMTYAWSGGRFYEGAHLYQYENGVTLNGGEVDLCKAFGETQGLWTIESEEDMGMTAEERADLDAFKRAVFAGKEQPGDDAARTAYANFKINETGQSVNDTAQSAIVVALQAAGKLTPGLTSDQVRAIADDEISRAHLMPAKPGG